MKLTRRELAPLTLSIAAACASPVPPAIAQQRRRPPARGRSATPSVPPVPKPRRPDDIGGIVLIGNGSPGGTNVMLAYAFPPSALPRTAGLTARVVPSERPLQAQFQVTARHANGSARIAFITLAAPALPEGQYVGVLLARVQA